MSESLPVPNVGPQPPKLRLLSPSLVDESSSASTAYEMKFLVTDGTAEIISQWASQHMLLDPYVQVDGGGYQTTTLYLDTPALDLFHRGAGYRRRKYRVRRYGEGAEAFVECKTRRGDATSKQRCNIPLNEVSRLSSCDPGDSWPAEGFRSEIERKGLLPICRITYQRQAWMQPTSAGSIRLTLDRQIRGVPADDWHLEPVHAGRQILENQVVCELKFRDTMPGLFKSLMEQAQLNSSAVSKYRRWMQSSLGIVPGNRSHE